MGWLGEEDEVATDVTQACGLTIGTGGALNPKP